MATAREPIIKAGYIAATSGIQQISIASGSRSIHSGGWAKRPGPSKQVRSRCQVGPYMRLRATGRSGSPGYPTRRHVGRWYAPPKFGPTQEGAFCAYLASGRLNSNSSQVLNDGAVTISPAILRTTSIARVLGHLEKCLCEIKVALLLYSGLMIFGLRSSLSV